MHREVRFHPAAVEDAVQAAGWYARRSERTATRFLDELDRVVDLVAGSADRFPDFDPGLRRAIFRRFPFYVVFRIDEDSIIVLAIAHGKRRPRFWQDRV